MSKPVIGITSGDPGGIGPEIIVKSLSQLQSLSFTPVIFGPEKLLDDIYYDQWKNRPIVQTKSIPENPADNTVYFRSSGAGNYDRKKPSKQNGDLSYTAMIMAVEAALNQEIDALVTGPISKESWRMADCPQTDHTSLLAAKCPQARVNMGFYTKELKVVLTTVHIPLKDVPGYITVEALDQAVDNAVKLAKLSGVSKPKIAICGLNPHAGENGLMGQEEYQVLSPFVETKKKNLPTLSGPHSADTLFYRARNGEFDVVVAMYHDQGLGPVKVLDFDNAVNITLGLPFVRTSPDHGTAFDIAFENKARTNSFQQALLLSLNTYAA